MRLVDILVRPMQRLTKYSLLLKAILKNTEDLNQRRDLLEMVRTMVGRISCVLFTLCFYAGKQDERRFDIESFEMTGCFLHFSFYYLTKSERNAYIEAILLW